MASSVRPAVLPASRPATLPLSYPLSVLVSDTFTRSDNASSLGSAESGQLYTAGAGTWGISGSKAYSASDADVDHAVLDSGVGNGTYQFDVTSSNYVNENAGMVLRYIDASNYLIVLANPATLTLYKKDAGAYTQLATAAVTHTNGLTYTYKAVVADSVITVYKDNVQVYQHTLAGGNATKYNNTLTKCGFYVWKVGAATLRFDNFSVNP